MNKIFKLLKEWMDLLIIFPITLIILIAMATGIHAIFPTAAVFDLGTLQLVALNVLLYGLVNGLGYLFFRINLGYDPFHKLWTIGLNAKERALIHVGLFIFQILIAFFILTRNL